MYIWQDLLAAFALVLVVEGIFPFLKPEGWRRIMGRIAERPNHALRLLGLMSMLVGVLLLYIVRQP